MGALRCQELPTGRASALFFAFLLLPSGLRPQATHEHPVPESLGVVSFGTSCRPGVQKDFERGVALLHSFAYSSAEATFRQVAEKDPNCAIVHWGIAMTYFHELWDPPIEQDAVAKGREEVRRAQEIGGGTGRERGFIHALALFYNRDLSAIPYRERVSQYEAAMADLARAYPKDEEPQVFYALALLASASPFDTTHVRRKHAVQILEPLFHKYPQHPGIAHYLIHACDNQEMAEQGLVAARTYSKVASSAPHALHMPSHIFIRLGMWDDSIASNLAARAAAHNQGDIGEELHAMDYLVYAYLQEGRELEASSVIRELGTMPIPDERDLKVAYASTAMPVRYAVERGQWVEAASIVPPSSASPYVTAVAVWARAIGFARTGHPADARQEVEKLRRLEQQLRASRDGYSEYWAKQVEIQELEAMAWSAQAEGGTDEARKLLREAADDEDATEKLPVTPGPIIPGREQLGDLLLQQGQPKQALKEFQLALSASPKRRGAIIGASRASEGSGTTTAHD